MVTPGVLQPANPSSLGGKTTIRFLGLLAFLVLAGPYAVSLTRSASPFDSNGDLLGYDFFAFYYAGELVNAGRADALYDWTAQRNLQRALVNQWGPTVQSYVCPYLNPPHYAWLMSWITPLGYAGALTLWWTFGLAAFLASLAVWQRWLSADAWRTAVALTIALPAWFQTFAGGQNTFYSLLIVTAACDLLLRRKDLLAGLVLSLLAYKFQLLLVPALFLAALARWRVLAGLAAGLALTIGLSLAYFGSDVLLGYARFAGELPGLMQTSGFYSGKQHSWYGFFELLGRESWSVPAIRGIAVAMSVLSVVAMVLYLRANRAALRNDGPDGRAAMSRALSVMLIATILASPHLFQYDLLLLAPAAVLWQAGASSHGLDRLRPIFAATIAIVIFWLSIANQCVPWLGIQWTPLLLAGWLTIVLQMRPASSANPGLPGL